MNAKKYGKRFMKSLFDRWKNNSTKQYTKTLEKDLQVQARNHRALTEVHNTVKRRTRLNTLAAF